MGYHSVRMALENPKRKIYKIYYNAGSEGGRITEIINISKDQGIISKSTSRTVLNQFADSTLHRGICADAEPICPESGDKIVDEMDLEKIDQGLYGVICLWRQSRVS